MPLDTLIVSVPAEARRVADWLRGVVDPITASGDRAQQVRTDSESEWAGQAGDLARERLAEVRQRADDVAAMARRYIGAFTAFADSMDVALRHMAEARAIAQSAGLAVTESVIQDPPASSADPGKGGPGHRLVEDDPGHAAQVADRQAKIDAYRRAEHQVLTAREIQQRAEQELETFMAGQWEKAWVTAPTVIASWAGAHLKANQIWREMATKSAGVADTAEKVLADPHVTPQARTRLLGIVAKYRTDSTVPAAGTRDASATAKSIEKLPKSLKASLMAELKVGAEGFRAGVPGLLLTGFSVADDLRQGKDPGKTIGTNAGSTVAGVVAGGAIAVLGGGPIAVAVGGTAVGTVVSTGLGYVYDGIKSGEHPEYTTPDGQHRTPPMSR